MAERHIRQKKDISENGIDESVQWFANPHTEVLNWERSPEAFVPNGSKSGFRTVAQKSKKYLSETGMDEDVHDFVNNEP